MLKRDFLCLAFVVLTGIALYAHTLHVPWYMDDSSIAENLTLRNLGESLNRIFSPRGFALFTFALNYHFGGLETFGYHLVNIAIHLMASCVVFLLFKRVFRNSALMPLLGALVFLAHPLQTQAVTYVVQRMTSLAGLFFFLALYFFVRAREQMAGGAAFCSPAHLCPYLGALLCGLLAVLTKENTVVLPLALLLFACYFLPFDRRWTPLFLYITPFFLAPLWIIASRLFLPIAAGQHLFELGSSTFILDRSEPVSPLAYLVTEFSVLWIYIRLLFIPYGQALDYSYPIVSAIFSWKNAAALLGLAGLACFAHRIRRSQPLISFGIAWFFIMLAVESSIIPLDPLFEHRLYLPMFGFTVTLMGLSGLLPNRRVQTFALLLLLGIFAALSWRRNALWNDPVAFYEDNLGRIPRSERVMATLADRYLETGRDGEAETLLKRAISTNPLYHAAYVNLLNLYGRQGRHMESYPLLQQGVKLFPRSAHLVTTFGLNWLHRGHPDKAVEYLNEAIKIDPSYSLAYSNLGLIHSRQGRWQEAENCFRKAVDISGDATAHLDLGRVLRAQGKMQESLIHLRHAWQLEPGDAGIVLHFGRASMEVGDRDTAVAMSKLLKELDRAAADELERSLDQKEWHGDMPRE